MDTLWSATALDSERTAAVVYHPTAGLRAIREGTATDGVDWTAFATKVEYTAREASIGLAWRDELFGANAPTPGRLLEIRVNDQCAWIGQIESVSAYRMSRGERSMSVTVRTLDGSQAVRNEKRVSDFYPALTNLTEIAADVARSCGLEDDEILLPATAYTTVHSSTQLAQTSAWDMIETILLPMGYTPFLAATGLLKAYSRDITRDADIVLTDDRIIEVNGMRARPSLSGVRVKWLDPNLTETRQQDRSLGGANIHAGYFQVEQRQKVQFSQDGGQRARDTYMVVKQSANSGLLPVCDEAYQQNSPSEGEIVLTTSYWVPALIALFAAHKAAKAIPDYVAYTATIPNGRLIEGGFEILFFMTMASVGTGSYEIRGTPYDYVNARNTTEAVDENAPPFAENFEELENDFVMDETHAQAVAVRELLFRARATNNWSLSIVDDMRVEPGDILQLPDGTRFFVRDYRRDVTRNAPAVLQIEGFQV